MISTFILRLVDKKRDFSFTGGEYERGTGI